MADHMTDEEQAFLNEHYLDVIKKHDARNPTEDKKLSLADLVSFIEDLRKRLPSYIVDGIEATIDKKDPKSWKLSLWQYEIAKEFVRDYQAKFYPDAAQSLDVYNEANTLTGSKISKENKEVLDSFFKKVAADNKAEYKPEPDAPNYQAKIIEKTGTLDIQAADNYISLKAKDQAGKEIVPDHKYFAGIAKLANQKGLPITFGPLVGDINKDEYKARLLIACLEAEPPVRRTNDPHIIIGNLEPETKQRLEGLLNKQKSKEIKVVAEDKDKKETNTKNPKKEPELTPNVEFISNPQELAESRQARMSALPPADKRTYMEDREFRYYQSEQKREEENRRNLDYKLMRNKGGYDSKSSPIGWSLDIEFEEDRHKANEYTKNYSRLEIYLGSVGAPYQKELITDKDTGAQTIKYQLFLGKREDAVQAVADINKIMPSKEIDEYDLRFIPSKHAAEFVDALPDGVIRRSGNEDKDMLEKAKALDIVPANMAPQSESSDAYHHFLGDSLEQYAAHKLYAKYAGVAYTGKKESAEELDDWIKEYLPHHRLGQGDGFAAELQKKMPEYEEVAAAYIKQMEQDNPDEIAKLKALASRRGLDFTKKEILLPPPPLKEKPVKKGYNKQERER